MKPLEFLSLAHQLRHTRGFDEANRDWLLRACRDAVDLPSDADVNQIDVSRLLDSMTELRPPPTHATSTLSGRWIDLLDPTPRMVDLEDLGRGLAFTCRWGRQFPWFYSVAEHSCAVADVLVLAGFERLELGGLLHDAAEAYMGDHPSPIKKLTFYQHPPTAHGIVYEGFATEKLTKYESAKSVEAKVLEAIFVQLGAPRIDFDGLQVDPDLGEGHIIEAADLVVRELEQRVRRHWCDEHDLPQPNMHPKEREECDEAFGDLELDPNDKRLPFPRPWTPAAAQETWVRRVSALLPSAP